jgi:hypothetical protein
MQRKSRPIVPATNQFNIMNRLVIVPDERLEAVGADLMPRLAAISREIDANNLVGLFYAEVEGMLEKASARQDGVLLVWAAEGNGYSPAWAGEGVAQDMVERVRADQGEGMIARVFGCGRGESAWADDLEISEWSNMEMVLGVKISAMSVSPVYVFGNCVAAVSVSTTDAVDVLPLPLSEVSGLLAKLIEDRILRAALGMESI